MAKKMFEIKPQTLKTPEQAYSELLGDSSENQVVDLKISLIDEIKEQPFHIRQEVIERIADSMASNGQLEPILVVPNPEAKGRYLLLAGRHRTRAASLIGNKTVKAVIKNNLTSTEQRRILLSTNTDRANDYSPSELAFAYKEQMELMKAEGAKKTVSAIAAANGTNRKTVDRLIHLTNLDKSLLHRVDEGEITIGAGYELSFLPPEKQKKIGLELFNQGKVHIDNKLARQLRENPDEVKTILSPEKSKSEIENTYKSVSKKKTKNNNSALNDKVPYEIQMTIASTLFYTYYNSIFREIICNYASTDRVVQMFKNHSTSSSMPCTIKYSPYSKYNDTWARFYYKGAKLEAEVKFERFQVFELSFKELDSIFREYLRKFVKKEDIVKIIKETET